jgi:hypothetical protein
MVSRRTANIAALICAFTVFVVGVTLFATIGPKFEAPTKTTTVVEASKGSGSRKTTKTVERKRPAKPAKKSQNSTFTLEHPKGVPSGKTTTTTEQSQRSFSERVLGHSGIILLQVGVILLAAFLTGAFVQRLLLGDFALKLGGLIDLGAAQSGEGTVEELTAKVAKDTEAVATQKGLIDELSKKVEEISTKSVAVGSLLVALDGRIKQIEKGLQTEVAEVSEGAVDPKDLLIDLQELADEAQTLYENVQEAPVPTEGEGAQLISDIADHLATMREASGLPTKDATHFERRIRKRQGGGLEAE